MGAFSCSGGRLSAFHKAVRAREDEAHERRPFSLATAPEELLSAPCFRRPVRGKPRCRCPARPIGGQAGSSRVGTSARLAFSYSWSAHILNSTMLNRVGNASQVIVACDKDPTTWSMAFGNYNGWVRRAGFYHPGAMCNSVMLDGSVRSWQSSYAGGPVPPEMLQSVVPQ